MNFDKLIESAKTNLIEIQYKSFYTEGKEHNQIYTLMPDITGYNNFHQNTGNDFYVFYNCKTGDWDGIKSSMILDWNIHIPTND